MKKDHRENVVGPWAATKLAALEEYLKFYGTVLRKQSFTRIYIDAFAGACVTKVRVKETASEPTPFFNEPDDKKAQEEFIEGSPIKALSVPNRFDKHYFFDRDKKRAKTLRDLVKNLDPVKDSYRVKGSDSLKGSDLVEVQVGDCNQLIRELAPSLKNPGLRGVAFLDPYGAHLEWTTLEALADTGTMEVVINFPVAMAINRLIKLDINEVSETSIDQLNKCFGTDKWHNVAYSKEPDMFGNEVMEKNLDVATRLLNLYVHRLKDLFPHVATPRLIHNTRKAPLYYLLWAGPNKLGLTGADYILKQGEKVTKQGEKVTYRV